MQPYFSKVIESPVGALTLVASEQGLAAILWKDDSPRRVRLTNVVKDENNPILLETERQLREYFGLFAPWARRTGGTRFPSSRPVIA